MVVAQLVDQLLPIPEILTSNQAIGKIYLTPNCFDKKKREKSPGIVQFKNIETEGWLFYTNRKLSALE